ncbi:tensin homolog isoform X1 [Haliotis asinina]|uniref:tensin homolog isoform X1 n=1 Tax=Haliotis asinina TaxID=109174 RepID=UPI00353243DB
MYLAKAKKQLEQQDAKELQERRDRHVERGYQRSNSTSGIPDRVQKVTELKLDDLPDGACFRPKNVLQGDQKSSETAVRPAEYIGSFSVNGSDQASRVDYVQGQLEGMRHATKSKRVLLVISLSGVKVCSCDGESVYMAHALKRISYATCDPDYCQFSFLAREPKGQINIQYCHAFCTNNSEEAEELNTIIGNAFKMAYAQQRERQPTFHELIEQQVLEQQAKFREVQEQEKRALQQKLNEIATPTPFSEKAIQRMEMRRQISDESLQQQQQQLQQQQQAEREREYVVGKNKVWLSLRSPKKAKQIVERVRHRSPVTDPSSPVHRRTESPPPTSSSTSQIATPRSALQLAASKRNSTPPQVPSHNSPHHSLTVAAIRESLDNSNNSNKFKGSPVTALKDEIDRRFMCNGSSPSHGERPVSMVTPKTQTHVQEVRFRHSVSEQFSREDRARYQQQRNSMANRPLPSVPRNQEYNPGNQGGSPRHRASVPVWRSFDDNQIQSTSRTQSNGISESPKRKPPRPMSEIVPSSTAGTLYDNRFPQNGCGQSPKPEDQSGGLYIYGPNASVSNQQAMYSPRRTESPTRQGGNAGKTTRMSRVDTAPEPVLRYQNDSPFQCEREDSESPGVRKGLESLMCLDRSHIEDEALRHAPWYQAGIPREIALEILQQEDVGSFIVRDSTTHPGCFALSVRVPKYENSSGISHYLIIKTQRGVKLKGLDKEWSNLTALVIHHTVMREMLPCTLKLPRKANNPTFKDSDKDDREEDPDYQRLSDFSNMMEQLKM